LDDAEVVVHFSKASTSVLGPKNRLFGGNGDEAIHAWSWPLTSV